MVIVEVVGEEFCRVMLVTTVEVKQVRKLNYDLVIINYFIPHTCSSQKPLLPRLSQIKMI